MLSKTYSAVHPTDSADSLSHTKLLAVTAAFTALTYVFTAFVNIRLPIAAAGGLIHLGNVPLFICAIIFGKKCGAIAGGIGMALFDLLSGWTAWAPFTLVIAALMGFTTGAITSRRRGLKWDALAVFAASIIKITGYYAAEGLIYGNWISPAASIPGNLIQIGTAAAIVLACVEKLRSAADKIILS